MANNYSKKPNGDKASGKQFDSGKRYDSRKPWQDKSDENDLEGLIVGRNAVKELLANGRDVEKIYVAKNDKEGSINLILGMAAERRIPIVELDRQKLDRMAPGLRHQGVIAVASAEEYCELEDILEYASSVGESPFVVILDGVVDPHNLGAIIRSAECMGAHGVVIPKRRAVGLTATVAKASAGAVSHMRVAKVTNLSAAIDELKERGLWIYGADMGGESIYEKEITGALGVVLGNEGDGISRLVREKCDFIVSIPMYGNLNSMNVSCAAAVILSKIAVDRRK